MGVTQGELAGRAYQKVREDDEVRLEDGLDLASAKDDLRDHRVRFSWVDPWVQEKGLGPRFLCNRFAIDTHKPRWRAQVLRTYLHPQPRVHTVRAGMQHRSQ